MMPDNKNTCFKKAFLILVLTLLFTPAIYAQKNQKTGVVVLGNGSAAIAAAFQSAMSGVETTILLEAEEFHIDGATLGTFFRQQGKRMAAGLELEFLKRMRKAKGMKDSAEVYVDQSSANAVIKAWADSTRKLRVIPRTRCVRIKASGSGWTLELDNDGRIKAAVLIDAGPSDRVNATLGLGKTALLWSDIDYKDLRYRTSIAGVLNESTKTAAYLSLYKFFNPAQNNFISLNGEQEVFSSGQAAGATAAYAVFYHTKTSLANLKAIQAELIKYRLPLMPFNDINPQDTNWKAIQFVGLSGVLKAGGQGKAFSFLPTQTVQTEEVRDVIKSYYYKAQLWFDDYPPAEMTIASTLDLVSKVGNKALENTRKEVEKKWKSRYAFTSAFDEKRVVSRIEFAVILYDYLNPFDVNVSPEGKVIR